MIRALNIDPIPILLGRAISSRSKWIAVRCADSPSDVVARRPHALAALSTLSDRLAPLRASWREVLPADSPSRDSDFPPIRRIATSLGYEDENFVRDFRHGAPIDCTIPPASALPSRIRPASSTVEEWRAGIPARNARIVERIQSEHGTDLAK